MMKKNGIAGLYFLLGLVFIVFDYLSVNTPGFVIKSLLIPVLAFLFVIQFRAEKDVFFMLMLAALLFSWAGDVLLEYQWSEVSLFVPGLISFLLAHIMYIIVFFSTNGGNGLKGRRAILLIPLFIFGILLIYLLFDDLNGMKVPVIFYAITILTMLAGALSRHGKVNQRSYNLILAGAILFVISDSVLAINRFGHPFKLAGVVVMATYILAQFLIVQGYIVQFRERPA